MWRLLLFVQVAVLTDGGCAQGLQRRGVSDVPALVEC
jgi:hypothetical protein